VLVSTVWSWTTNLAANYQSELALPGWSGHPRRHHDVGIAGVVEKAGGLVHAGACSIVDLVGAEGGLRVADRS
jgi:hypothetical protein